MSNVNSFYDKSKNMGEFAKHYFNYLKEVLDAIDPKSLNELEAEFEDARENSNTIFIAGNGGSASTATTMANDIGFDVIRKVNPEKHFRVFALTDNSSVMTAIANDVGYENLFVGQLRVHYRPGDKLIVISASGNSPNVVKAAEWVKGKGGKVIGFLGFDGGKLKELSDVIIHAKTVHGEYGPVEDAHLVMNHVLAHWFQNKLK
ncbi:MAG: SIS domain-containing protein [Patescibacteria group bacterium]